MQKTLLLLGSLLLVGLCWTTPEAQAQNRDGRTIQVERQDRSRPLRDMIGTNRGPRRSGPWMVPNRLPSGKGHTENPSGAEFEDVLRQSQPGPLAPSFSANFDGSSDDDNAAVVGFRIVPPDTQGDVGPNHYVQWINVVAEVFDKNGTSLTGPFAGNDFFAGFGGQCENTNDGDPVVLYDEAADRWLDQTHPYRDGRSGERVLDAVDTFTEQHQGRLRPKPLNLWRKLKIRREMGYFGLR